MKITNTCTAVLILCIFVAAVHAREKKEYAADVNYDESEVPHYDLPELLVSAEGRPITTPDEWMNVRRPQILSLFANMVYGRVPVPESPIEAKASVFEIDQNFMDGKTTRKAVSIHFRNDFGEAEMLVLVFVPNGAAEPAPTFMKLSFDNTRSSKFEASDTSPGRLRRGGAVAQTFRRDAGENHPPSALALHERAQVHQSRGRSTRGPTHAAGGKSEARIAAVAASRR